MKNNVYNLDYLIKSYDIDICSELKLSHILQFAQEAAEQDACSFNMGRVSCLEHNIVWVVARTKVIINKLPLMAQKVTIKTWPGKPKKILYPRYFTIEDEEGNILVKLISVWSLFDIVNRRLVFQTPLLKDYPDTSNAEEILDMPSKIEEIKFVNKFIKKPVYSDFDCNNHVNNTKYVEWALNLLDMEYLKTHIVLSAQVDYHKEVKQGDHVEIEYELKENKLSVNYRVDNSIVAICLIEFKER